MAYENDAYEGFDAVIPQMLSTLPAVIMGVVIVLVLWLRLNSNYLKLFTAVVVALFLAVPYLRAQRKSSFARFRRRGAGGDA